MTGGPTRPTGSPAPVKSAASTDPAEPTEPTTAAVRPYALTGGRTRARRHLPLEALVRSGGGSGHDSHHDSHHGSDDVTLLPERRAILRLTAEDFLSVAELSAHLELPIGVVRVLVADLEDAGLVTVPAAPTAQPSPASTLRLLESVLDGMSSL